MASTHTTKGSLPGARAAGADIRRTTPRKQETGNRKWGGHWSGGGLDADAVGVGQACDVVLVGEVTEDDQAR